jgi:nanoRNase/pAp phosphatase (c-di-AMP/oligoRNAs hydrolase)
LLIGHHAKGANSINAKYEWVNPQSSSVAQMISQLIKKPTAQQAKILLLAMICDSAGFSNSDSNTFLQASKLLKIYGKDYGELERMLHSHASIQTRLRVLEGLRNISFSHNGGFICATAQVASNESQIADIFLKAGADCAFVASASKSKCTICARMRRRHTSYVDLSLIMQKVGKVIGGSGGGHPCASGASGNLVQNITDALILSQSLFFAQRLARIKI